MRTQEADFPYPVTDTNYLRPERYTSVEFHELELEKLWYRSWQVACRVEDVPKVGNYIEYKIGDQSVVVVRIGPGADEIKAYRNVCLHRGRQLANGSGSFRGGRIVCRYHGWTWNLDGTTLSVFGGDVGFEPSSIQRPDTDLMECRMGIWAGMVFVNLDPDAAPLTDFLAPIASIVEPLKVPRMKTLWWQQVEIEANWKLDIEAFMESYHVCYTHPQFIFGAKPDASFADGIALQTLDHGHTYFLPKTTSRYLEADWAGQTEIDPFDRIASMLRTLTPVIGRDIDLIESLRGKPIPDGSSIQREMFGLIYADAARRGIELPDPELARTWGAVYHVFPNLVIYPFFGNCWILRARPNGPDKSLIDMWMVTLPAVDQEFRKPVCEGPFLPGDTDKISLITVQDFGNLEPQQRGLHARHLGKIRLSRRWEALIAHKHIAIDRMLGQ